jgi:hypothetical protein
MAKSSNGCVRRIQQSTNQFRERFGRTSLGQEGEPGRLFPRVYAEPLQRRNIAERYSIFCSSPTEAKRISFSSRMEQGKSSG